MSAFWMITRLASICGCKERYSNDRKGAWVFIRRLFAYCQHEINDAGTDLYGASAVIPENPLHIVLIAVPLVFQAFRTFFIAYHACNLLKLPYSIAAPAGMIGAFNFFVPAVAVAVALSGTTSPVVPATTVGVQSNRQPC